MCSSGDLSAQHPFRVEVAESDRLWFPLAAGLVKFRTGIRAAVINFLEVALHYAATQWRSERPDMIERWLNEG